jgi:glycosyltransferase involved in cell wall biosynthesis
MGQKRILVVCDDPSLNTGYARVGRFVAQTLHANDYRVKYLPTNATQPEVDRKQWGFECLPFNANDPFANHSINHVLSDFKPSLVMVFGEFGFMGYIGNVCRQLGIKSLYYMPVEGTAYPPHFVHMRGGHIDYKLTLQKFNYIVAYSQFGAECINRLLPGIVTDVIPHQVDTTIFRPLDRARCLSAFFPQLVTQGIDKLFVVGHIGRNQRRKGTDLVVQGFAEFVKQFPKDSKVKPLLFLVTDPKDTQGYNLYDMVDACGLKGNVCIHEVVGGKAGPADNQLAEIYSTFDVALFPHRAEGFGLPVLEAMATGVNVLTTNYASPAEFGRDCCTFIEPAWLEPCMSTNTNWAVINPKDIGQQLLAIFNSGDTKRENKHATAIASQYDNVQVGKKWLRLLADLRLPEMSDVEDVLEPTNTISTVVADYLTMVEE